MGKQSLRKLMASVMVMALTLGVISQSVFAASKLETKREGFDEFSGKESEISSASIKSTGNDWVVLGIEGFSKGAVDYTSIALDNNNTPYVAYVDNGTGKKVTVKKFTEGAWKTVGNEGFSAKKAKDVSIVFDKSNNPYVAYIEEPGDKIVVNNLVNNKWKAVGGYVGFGEDISIAIDSKGTPYVAYTYSAKNLLFGIKNLNGLVVSKYEKGKWKTEFNVGGVQKHKRYSDPSVAFDALDNPYIAFNNDGITVMKLSGSKWKNCNLPPCNKKGKIKHLSLAIDDKNTPIAAFIGGNGKATVSKFTKDECWEISKGKAEHTSIALDGNGTPYVTFVDSKNGGKAVVKKYEGGKWYTVGKEGFSKKGAKFTSIVADSKGNLYVVYQDAANKKKATVCTYAEEIKEIRVSFNSDGGTLIDDQYVAYNGKVQKPEDPIKVGYIFENWYTDSTFAKVFDFETPVTSDITIYAKYTKQETADLTIKYEGKGTVSDWTYGETKSFALGTDITLTAFADENSVFMYWKNSVNRVVSTETKYTFEIGYNETLTAYFFEKSNRLVTFKDGKGEIIKTVNLKEGEEIVFPESPAMFGYKFIGWDKSAEEIKQAQEDIVVTALYEKVAQTVTVAVYGGSGSGEYNIKDYTTIVANEPEAGQKFAYWEDQLGNILSYNTNYGFYALRDIKLTAVYVPESEDINKQARIAITSITKTDDKISFVAERVVPEGNTVVLHGIIVTNNSLIGSSETDFVIGKQDVLKADATTKGLVGIFVLNKSANFDETWFARGFVIYKDSEGNVFTIYSPIVEETMD